MKVLLAPGAMWPEPGGAPLVGSVPGLPAPAVAAALASGWGGVRPHDELTVLPLGDGGPGSAETLPAGLVARKEQLSATDPLGYERTIDLLQLASPAPANLPGVSGVWGQADQAPTCYLDAASLIALPADRALAGQHARDGSSRGVGELLKLALERTGVGSTLVMGLTRTALHDGGSGLLEAFGGFRQARELLRRHHLVLALGDELPLGGLGGAGAGLPQISDVDETEAQALDLRAGAIARSLGRQVEQAGDQFLPVVGQPRGRLSATSWGTGAAGGVALVLRLAGGVAMPGARALGELTSLAATVPHQDLCVSATGSLYTLGTNTATVLLGELAAAQAVPTVLVAGRCRAPRVELAEAAVVSVYELESVPTVGGSKWLPWEELGSVELKERLRLLGGRLARSWSR